MVAYDSTVVACATMLVAFEPMYVAYDSTVVAYMTMLVALEPMYGRL